MPGCANINKIACVHNRGWWAGKYWIDIAQSLESNVNSLSSLAHTDLKVSEEIKHANASWGDLAAPSSVMSHGGSFYNSLKFGSFSDQLSAV